MSAFSTFGGTSRRPRQVNMSGRKTNPFTAVGSGAGSQAAIAKAQHEREQRHREGERLKAAKSIQRAWHRHASRTKLDRELRHEFDEVERCASLEEHGQDRSSAHPRAYRSEIEAYRQLLLLHRFFDSRNPEDLPRLQRCIVRRRQTRQECRAHVARRVSEDSTDGRDKDLGAAGPMLPVRTMYAHLQRWLISMLDRIASQDAMRDPGAWFAQVENIIRTVTLLSRRIPQETARNAEQIYAVLSRIITALPDTIFYNMRSFSVVQTLWGCPIDFRVEESYRDDATAKWFGQDAEEDDSEEEELASATYSAEYPTNLSGSTSGGIKGAHGLDEPHFGSAGVDALSSENSRARGGDQIAADTASPDEDILMHDAPSDERARLALQKKRSLKPGRREPRAGRRGSADRRSFASSQTGGGIAGLSTSPERFSADLLHAYEHCTKPLFTLLGRLSTSANEDAARCTAYFLKRLSNTMDFDAFVTALDQVTARAGFEKQPDMSDPGNRVRLTATLIYFQQGCYYLIEVEEADPPYRHYIQVVSRLIASLPPYFNFDTLDEDVLNAFTREQLLCLRSNDHLKSLLARISSTDGDGAAAEVTSSHVLALIKFFPQEADAIRMKLCLQAAKVVSDDGAVGWLPALSWFWKAAAAAGSPTRIVSEVQAHPHNAVHILTESTGKYAYPWKVILCFLELYTFMTKVTDDDEFLAGDKGISYKTLPLQDIRRLAKFLMNLGFAMYFYGPEISGVADRPDVDGLRARFSSIRAAGAGSSTAHAVVGAPITVGGARIEYFKQVVTGLLRMLYQRDSRRNFVDDGFWLMTRYLDMGGFIEAVVMEEERRREAALQDSDTEGDEEDGGPFSDHLVFPRASPRRQERAHNRTLVHTYMANVAPRLEILRHLPFMILFPVRLKIFRQFVHEDKFKRRSGAVEADVWRMTVMSFSGEDGLKKHHATVQRGREIQDSMAAFWDLGENLKEPIQITFLDKYRNEEIGIDGGGITKEFLMAVTKQALSELISVEGELMNAEGQMAKTRGVVTQLFVANDQQFLYPNPTAVEEMQLGINAAEDQARVAMLLRYYEFLGRIIGKCLYEGILIDALFAGFFALKWAGDFRADLNSLRDLDEELYRNMLQLKNYDGDVEDLGLTFSIVDRIPDRSKTDTDRRAVVRELAPNGANTAVNKGNRLVFIDRVARYRLVMQCKPQTDAFLRGIASIVQPSWLSMFNQGEIQALIGGDAVPIDLADLRRNTLYGGVYQIGDDGQEHPTVRMFWNVLQSLSEEDKRAVLKFVTSTPRAPLLGFGSLTPKFSIRDGGNDEHRLPTAATCVNLLKLPTYHDPQRLRQKLLTAITSGAGFDLS